MLRNLRMSLYMVTLTLSVLVSDGLISVSEAQSCSIGRATVMYWFSPLYMTGDVGSAVSSISPTTTYTQELCPSRYVVEATQTANLPNLSAGAAWMGGNLNQASCSRGHVSALVYGFNPSTKAWEQIGSGAPCRR